MLCYDIQGGVPFYNTRRRGNLKKIKITMGHAVINYREQDSRSNFTCCAIIDGGIEYEET